MVEEEGRAGRKGRRRKGRRRAARGVLGAGLRAAGTFGRHRLHRAALVQEMARLAAGDGPGAPLPSPAVATACPQTSRAALLPGRGAARAETRGEREGEREVSRLAAQFLSPPHTKSRPQPRGAAAAAASLLFVTEESRNVRNVPCVTYLGVENLCPAESARGNITSDEMTMIKISLSPAPSPSPEEARAPRGRTAGGWGAEGAGPQRRAPGRVLVEPRGTQASGSGTHGWGSRGGKEVVAVGNRAFLSPSAAGAGARS